MGTLNNKENQYNHSDADSSVMCPFLAYEDSYRWANLYDELDAMIDANILIYPFAELRRFRREGVALFGPDIDSLPLASCQVVKAYDSNRQLIEACGFNKTLNCMILETAADREAVAEQERMMIEGEDLKMLDFQISDKKIDEESSDVLTVSVGDDSSTSTTFISSEDAWGLDPINNSKVLTFEDTFEKHGLVYMVQLDPCQRRIVLTFRGSVTDASWVSGLQGTMESVPNPNIEREPTLPSHVRVHGSFRKALYEKEDGVSVLQTILRNHVFPLASKYPGYKLYVTGYSAGAAIATLFAFESAAQPDSRVPKPVTLVSFGSSAVGDEDFLNSFQYLERLGKLRAVRVVNRKDPIPLYPKVSSTSFSPFIHTGMTLKLNSKDDCAMSYPAVSADGTSCNTDVFHGLVDGWDQMLLAACQCEGGMNTTMPEHTLREYNLRLLLNRPALEAISLHDLYAKRALVGNLVPEV